MNLNEKQEEWQELDFEFRQLIRKWSKYQIEVLNSLIRMAFTEAKFNTLQGLINMYTELYRSCYDLETFINVWKSSISAPTKLVTDARGTWHTENYLDISMDLSEHSHRFSSMKELIEYATTWTKKFITSIITFRQCRTLKEIEELEDKIFNEDQFLVVDHAFYALYVVWKSDSILLVKENNKELLKAIAKNGNIFELVSHRRFEEIVAFLFECLGCKVKLTQQTRDFGADILAWHGGPLNSEILTAIQVKKYSKK